jgi:hypothetical protein
VAAILRFWETNMTVDELTALFIKAADRVPEAGDISNMDEGWSTSPCSSISAKKGSPRPTSNDDGDRAACNCGHSGTVTDFELEESK